MSKPTLPKADKCDPRLRERLEAGDPTLLRAIVKLETPTDANSEAPSPQLRPSDFPTNREYRKALIERRRSEILGAQRSFRARLDELGVTVKGEGLLGLIVVEGEADALREALDDDRVVSATMDQVVEPDQG